jgi:hypothetical protein
VSADLGLSQALLGFPLGGLGIGGMAGMAGIADMDGHVLAGMLAASTASSVDLVGNPTEAASAKPSGEIHLHTNPLH